MKRVSLLTIGGVVVLAISLGYLLPATTPVVLAEDPPAIHVCALEDEFFVTADGGCKDTQTGLVWSLQTSLPENWETTRQIADDLEEGGYQDWRLATIEELQTVNAHGAPTHFAHEGYRTWSSLRRGTWAFQVDHMGNGDEYKVLATSFATAVFVREAAAEPPVCGEGTCDPGEDSCNCPADCGPPPTNETDCADSFDNDCDGLIDCEDALDCDSDPICADPCNDDGICDPGEDCENCPDECAGQQTGKPSGRFCCGNGILEEAEGDGSVCDGNP
jgi:hypothetical protein